MSPSSLSSARSPALRRALLAGLAALSIAAVLSACGDGTTPSALPLYDGSFADIDGATLALGDAGPDGDAALAIDAADSATDAHDGAASDAGDSGHDGGDASHDAHFDAE